MQILISAVMAVSVLGIYFGGIFTLVRATRNPENVKCPHPGRARVALLMLFASFVLPFLVLGLWCVIVEQDARWQMDHRDTECNLHIDLHKENIENLEDMTSMAIGNPENVNQSDVARIEKFFLEHIVQERKNIDYYEHRKRVYSGGRISEFHPLWAFPIYSLIYAVPCSVLGIGYVISIRKQKRKPGLVTAVFAGFTWPLLVLLVLLGLAVFFLLSLQWWQALIITAFLAFVTLLIFAGVTIFFVLKWKNRK